MSVLILILVVLVLIVFLKTKKIKDLHKTLIKKESTFIVLYEQKFETLLKLIKKEEVNIQESIVMDISEMRKKSLFFVKNNDNKSFIILEEKIQNILKNIEKENIFENNDSNPSFIEINTHMKDLNTLIEETKIEYNNLIDHFNQETTDFFGKKIKKQLKNLKKFQHV